ncbi:MAG: hypothetical protein E7167_04190 [Firmicutes bacterium]|nr:hypothetical protein [Bacillota bacterium]
MKKNKVVLPLIIILLLCFLPGSIYGIISHVKYSKEGGNPQHLHKYENKLFYYDANDQLIGTYECQTDICDDAIPIIDDEYIKHYVGANEAIGIFGGEYTFIQDGDTVKLHNIKSNISIAQFLMIKNYGTTLANGNIIVKDSQGNYGLFNMNNIIFTIPAKYQFMGIANNNESSNLAVDRIAVKEQDSWYIIDASDQRLTSASSDPIYDYDKTYIYYLTEDNKYTIFTYNGVEILANYNITKIATKDSYHILINNSNQAFIYDINYENVVFQSDYSAGKVDFEIEDNIVNIYSGDEIVEKFNLTDGEKIV